MLLDVRAAIVPLSEIRRHGRDVRIGRYAPENSCPSPRFQVTGPNGPNGR
ncbi:DUF3095 family protein [Pseudochelatococcus sp. B33]